jgi:hypothetical protein
MRPLNIFVCGGDAPHLILFVRLLHAGDVLRIMADFIKKWQSDDWLRSAMFLKDGDTVPEHVRHGIARELRTRRGK